MKIRTPQQIWQYQQPLAITSATIRRAIDPSRPCRHSSPATTPNTSGRTEQQQSTTTATTNKTAGRPNQGQTKTLTKTTIKRADQTRVQQACFNIQQSTNNDDNNTTNTAEATTMPSLDAMPSLASALFTTTNTAVAHTLNRLPRLQYNKYSRGCYTQSITAATTTQHIHLGLIHLHSIYHRDFNTHNKYTKSRLLLSIVGNATNRMKRTVSRITYVT